MRYHGLRGLTNFGLRSLRGGRISHVGDNLILLRAPNPPNLLGTTSSSQFAQAQYSPQMHNPQLHPLAPRQQPHRLDGILDLPPIQIRLGQQPQFLLTQIQARPNLLAPEQEFRPDLKPQLNCQFGIIDRDVDQGFKGGIDGAHAVGGQEHQSLVVFEES
jgi:hypothetical protein